ncbi:hypothetical protein [Sphingobium yanoikuyae]|uniref:hypothetical protein n=1 Tax=Sphingobium yanoikuyae TaxID=13690 RepID=UPI0022DE2902|nr:hypothetical protein [Sphingobium yanoikuyae]WBQ19074.1 hypothetical protein PAE53_24900 [Sphingobium yanoikuyae]
MSKDDRKPFAPPAYDGDQKATNESLGITPLNRPSAHDRGQRAKPGSGPVVGSGAGAGGTYDGNEDYDEDSAGGGGAPSAGADPSKSDSSVKTDAAGDAQEPSLPPDTKSL